MNYAGSADLLEHHIGGQLIAVPRERLPREVVAQVFLRPPMKESFIVPAVSSPMIVWIVSGSAQVEERAFGGEWMRSTVQSGSFFIVDSNEPYELRWRSHDGQPLEVLHMYFGSTMLKRASGDVFDKPERLVLREVSGVCDDKFGSLVEPLLQELKLKTTPSALVLESLLQAIAVHLIREYANVDRQPVHGLTALPAPLLRRVAGLMASDLANDFSLKKFSNAVNMSETHFSRQFKAATGLAPSQHFIRMRMLEACRLLRHTDRSVISIGMEVGYKSPSHFAHVLRKAIGMSPREYRSRE